MTFGATRPLLPRRFYKTVTTAPAEEGGTALLLDGRGARTPARHPLVLPTPGLANLVAAEWKAVGDTVDPRLMPVTRLVNSVLDGVRVAMDDVQAEVLRYAASDLLAYRAETPAKLVAAQAVPWDPIVSWSRDELKAPILLAEGVMFVQQPESSLRHIGIALSRQVGHGRSAPFLLGAVHVMTTLTGSALLALAVVSGRLIVQEAWQAAHVDEDFQIDAWGSDAEATARRQARWVDMETASRVAAAGRGR